MESGINRKKILGYLLDAGRSSNLPDFDFDSKSAFCEVDREDVARGRLPQEIVSRLFESTRESSDDGMCEIVISLVTCEAPRRKSGLLLLPCLMTREGELICDVTERPPWIPVNRLMGRGTGEKEVMVGELASYWEFRNKRGLFDESSVSAWGEALSYANRLFCFVSGRSVDRFVQAYVEEGHGDGGFSITADRCYIRAGKLVQANGAILEAYAKALEHTGPLPLLSRLLLADADPTWPVGIRAMSSGPVIRTASRQLVSGLEADGEFVKSMDRACGFMGSDYPLADSQRLAIHAFLRSGEGDITAVAGPPGTGKTTMLQAVIANVITDHALDRLDAPLIVCTSTNNQAITNIIRALGSIAPADGDALGARWLPEASSACAKQEPMHGVAVYCPAARMMADAEKRGYLVEDAKKSRAYTAYSESRYVSSAQGYFRACLAACKLLGTAAGKPLIAVRDDIHGALVQLDKDRRKIIECAVAMRSVPKGIAEAEYRQDEERALEACRKARDRMSVWVTMRKRERGLFRRLINRLRGFPSDERSLIRMHSLPDEGGACAASGFDEVIEYYGRLIQSLDEAYGECKGRHAAYRRAQSYSEELKTLLDRLCKTGVLDRGQAERMFGASSLLELDRILDTTLRYAEFWLALHYYEASWLIVASGAEEGLIDSDSRFRTSREYMDRYWPQAASLTPCFVMTVYQIPKHFKLYQGAHKEDDFDWGRADLLIVDEAGQVDTALGASSFAFAKRAVVVGDEKQLSPIWSYDPESDEARGVGHVGEGPWSVMFRRGMTASCPSSVMRAASHACAWGHKVGSRTVPGLFLSEHYRCQDGIIGYCNDLSYDGMLKPCRSRDGYVLDGAVERPFCFELVSDSRDRASGASRVNPIEARAVVSWIERNWSYLHRVYTRKGVGENEIIGIVTPFAAQARLIRSQLKKSDGHRADDIQVGTAHRLQGAERPVVLFSSVYGDNDSSMAFLSGSPELMNVAVSRAKDLFVMFGSQRLWDSEERAFRLVREHAGAPTFLDFEHEGEPDRSPRSRCDGPEGAVTAEGPGVITEFENSWGKGNGGVQSQEYWFSRGYVTASGMVRTWRNKMSAWSLNTMLCEIGYLRRSETGRLVPTEAGRQLGMELYCGSREGEAYVNVCYSPDAQKELCRQFVDGGSLDA